MAKKKRSGLAPGKVRIKGGVIQANLSGVEVSKKRMNVPEGHYEAKITKADVVEFNSGKQGVTWVLELVEAGKYNGAPFWYHNVLINEDGSVAENSLWSFRGFLEAVEPRVSIPDRALKIPVEKLVGRHVVLDIVTGEYKGKPQSEINDVLHPDLMEEDDEGDDLDEDDEDYEDDDLDDEDEDEDEDEEEDEDEVDLEDEDEDEDDFDEDDLDEDEI